MRTCTSIVESNIFTPMIAGFVSDRNNSPSIHSMRPLRRFRSLCIYLEFAWFTFVFTQLAVGGRRQQCAQCFGPTRLSLSIYHTGARGLRFRLPRFKSGFVLEELSAPRIRTHLNIKASLPGAGSASSRYDWTTWPNRLSCKCRIESDLLTLSIFLGYPLESKYAGPADAPHHQSHQRCSCQISRQVPAFYGQMLHRHPSSP